MNSSVFGKTMKTVKKHKSMKLVKSDKRRYHLVSEPNYHSKITFTKITGNRDEKNKGLNKSKQFDCFFVFLFFVLVLEFSRIEMQKGWYHYIKQKMILM